MAVFNFFLCIKVNLPPWIIRLRIWDSYGTYSTKTFSRPLTASSAIPTIASKLNESEISVNIGTYYYSAHNPKFGKNVHVNIDNAWNPVDTYIYGPTQSSIFNDEDNNLGFSRQQQNNRPGTSSGSSHDNDLSSTKKNFTNLASSKHLKNLKESSYITTIQISEKADFAITSNSGKSKRRLMLEIYDYEKPKLCDHTAMAILGAHKLRPCSSMESYVSSGKDMVSYFYIYLLFL